MSVADALNFYHSCGTRSGGRCHCFCNQQYWTVHSSGKIEKLTLSQCDKCPDPHPTMSFPKPSIYTERGAIQPLRDGKQVLVRGIGNSMTPILRSGEVNWVVPISEDVPLEKGDVVLAKVHGNVYMHKITAVKNAKKNKLYQISNNHGHVNGWTNKIYGKLLVAPSSSNGQDM